MDRISSLVNTTCYNVALTRLCQCWGIGMHIIRMPNLFIDLVFWQCWPLFMSPFYHLSLIATQRILNLEFLVVLVHLTDLFLFHSSHFYREPRMTTVIYINYSPIGISFIPNFLYFRLLFNLFFLLNYFKFIYGPSHFYINYYGRSEVNM